MGTRYESVTCEPFRAWNRLEPRPRKKEFDQVVRAEVHDPLWMLARQWQFGEFKGEDTGSAIFAKIQIEQTQIKKIQAGGDSKIVNLKEVDALEQVVESVPLKIGFKARVKAGQYFLRLLDARMMNEQDYKEKLLELYPIQKIEIEDSDTSEIKVQKAHLLANTGLVQFLEVFAGNAFDGFKLYEDFRKNLTASIHSIKLHSNHLGSLSDCAARFISWFEKCFDAIPEQQHSSWIHQKLEYKFACSLPEKAADASLLVVDEYASGKLDWYAFDIEKNTSVFSDLVSATLDEGEVKKETFSFIPTEARFAGMPNNRWWEFEDAKVDLGNLSAESTDIAKSITAEYALIYGNDWFVIPYTLPVGSLSKINGLMITDVFGQKTFIEAAAQGETDDWASWGLFNLSVKKSDATKPGGCDTRLFLPPVFPKIHESEPIEEVLMLRDEMANMVWGIEKTVNNFIDAGTNGHSLANERHKILHGEKAPSFEANPGALLKYILANEVPENWIPFIPSNNDNSNRSMQLQRASMPRKLNGQYSAIRPVTQLLRYGFKDKAENEVAPYIYKTAHAQLQSYFINEEEVPRSGALISGKLQRSRWLNGKIVNWYGYKKGLGRGEGSSGLKFDELLLLKKNKEKL